MQTTKFRSITGENYGYQYSLSYMAQAITSIKGKRTQVPFAYLYLVVNWIVHEFISTFKQNRQENTWEGDKQ